MTEERQMPVLSVRTRVGRRTDEAYVYATPTDDELKELNDHLKEIVWPVQKCPGSLTAVHGDKLGVFRVGGVLKVLIPYERAVWLEGFLKKIVPFFAPRR